MKKTLLLIFLLSTFNSFAQEPSFVVNQLLVQLVEGKDATVWSENINSIDITEIKLISRPLNIWLLEITPSSISEEDAVGILYKNADVLVAQKNHTVTMRETTPNDPLFGSQWQYFQTNDKDIDADLAWDVTTGGLTPNNDVIVAGVVDNGYNINHPDLVENLWENTGEIPGNGIDDDNNNYIDDVNGWNAYNSNGNIPQASHGTAVFGIVGARGDNGIGVTGVNWDVKVMPIAGSSGNEATVLEAYSYILESRMLYNSTNGAAGAFVVATNASFGVDFGDPADFPLWCGMYDTLGENGILNCGATINGNFDVDVIGDVPTACSSEFLISVTNTDITDNKVTNAGYGLTTIDLGAPGQGAFTTSTNSYGGFGGTSGATPHVTGTIALLYAAPCQSFADLSISDPAEAARMVRDYILSGVDPNPSLEGITTTGGRLNVNNAVQGLMDDCDILSAADIRANSGAFSMHPNPSKGIVYIQAYDNKLISSIEIYGIDGKNVISNNNPSNNEIDVTGLTKGMYVVRVSFEGDNSIYNKLLVKE